MRYSFVAKGPMPLALSGRWHTVGKGACIAPCLYQGPSGSSHHWPAAAYLLLQHSSLTPHTQPEPKGMRTCRIWSLRLIWTAHSMSHLQQVPRIMVPAGQSIDTGTIQCTFVSHPPFQGQVWPSNSTHLPNGQKHKFFFYLWKKEVYDIITHSWTPNNTLLQGDLEKIPFLSPHCATQYNLQFILSTWYYKTLRCSIIQTFLGWSDYLAEVEGRRLQSVWRSPHNSASLPTSLQGKPTMVRKTRSLNPWGKRTQTSVAAALWLLHNTDSWSDSTFQMTC